jgi:hypothetical protein
MSGSVCGPAWGRKPDVLTRESSGWGRYSPRRAADTWSLAGECSGRGRATPSLGARTSWLEPSVVESDPQTSAARVFRHRDGAARHRDGHANPRVCPPRSSGFSALVVRLGNSGHQDGIARPRHGSARHRDGAARHRDGHANPQVCPPWSSGFSALVVTLPTPDTRTAQPDRATAAPDLATARPDTATAVPDLGCVRTGHRVFQRWS